MSESTTTAPASVLDRARSALGARMAKDDLRLVLENVIAYAADLEAEREKLVRWHLEDGKAADRLRRKVASLKELQAKDDAEYAEAIAERDRALKLAAELEAARIDCVAVPRWEYELMEQQRERATRAEARIDELEAERSAWPSRFTATPAEVDWFLRKHLTEETLLNYQRAIGNRAVEEAAEEIRQETARLKAHGVLEPDKDWAASSAADWIDTSKEGGHYPSRLLCARHDGFNPCPGAPRCTPREDEAVTS